MPEHFSTASRRLMAFALALVLATGPAWEAFATPGEIHAIKSKTAHLRAGPNANAHVIGGFVHGDRVMEFQRRGQWLKVQQLGRVAPLGWVHGGLLIPEPWPTPEKVQIQPEPEEARPAAPTPTYKARHRNLRWRRLLIRRGRHVRRHDRLVHVKGEKGHHGRKNRRLHRPRPNGQPHGASCGTRRKHGSCL